MFELRKRNTSTVRSNSLVVARSTKSWKELSPDVNTTVFLEARSLDANEAYRRDRRP